MLHAADPPVTRETLVSIAVLFTTILIEYTIGELINEDYF